MATAAIPSRSVTEKFTRVPNSFIENQHLFKLPASRALALIVFRREQDPTGPKTVSDRHWESWTGLGCRAKELAVKELSGFGMQMQGRGDTAKFSWDWTRWNEAIKTKHQGEYDPKRKEREARGVAAKAGAKVHEECADQGCAMLRAGNCPSSTNEAAASSKPASGLFLTRIAQPVTQTVEQATEKAWAATMAALCSFFPMIGALFLVRLLAAVRSHFPDVSDVELADAVRLAYIPQQKGEGLFLHRVPRAVLMLRQRKKDKPKNNPQILTDDHVRIARDIIRAVESGTDEETHGAFAWKDSDVEWAREILFHAERRE